MGDRKNPADLTGAQKTSLAEIATTNNLRVLTKRAYGFHSRDALIATALLTRGR